MERGPLRDQRFGNDDIGTRRQRAVAKPNPLLREDNRDLIGKASAIIGRDAEMPCKMERGARAMDIKPAMIACSSSVCAPLMWSISPFVGRQGPMMCTKEFQRWSSGQRLRDVLT